MKKETYEFTDEQITKMNYYDRRAALIAELNKNLVKNRETDDYDYIDLKGINDVLHPLKCKYKITDMPCKEDNGDMSLIMIDSLTGEKHGKITIPWQETMMNITIICEKFRSQELISHIFADIY